MDVGIQLHGLSYHLGKGYQEQAEVRRYNPVNPGLSLRLQPNPDFAVQAGGYYNSYRKASYYAAVDYSPLEVFGLRAGIFAGFVTGYPAADVLPAGGFAIRKDYEKANVILRFVPPSQKTHGAFVVELGWRFR